MGLGEEGDGGAGDEGDGGGAREEGDGGSGGGDGKKNMEEEVQAYKDREDYLSGLYGYGRADYEDFNGPSSYYPYGNPPPPPPHNQEYYYEPDLPHFSSYREEYDDYYNEYPQPASEEPQDSVHSKLDALINMVKGYHEDIKDMKKGNEVRDKAHEVLVMQVGQLAEEIAQIKHERDVLANGTMVDCDVVEEVIDLSE
ncbi:transcription factor jun-D-like [Helianthus annuus]|uniref:transcription factor jun-D-like n=1 Tax=Helianthus annuus TaxID=4232 RepID=UPI000B908671|nr:transcription factor jun-D-like [Helianthus annuus]